MERKMLIADFAALVGTTSKTIYQKINNFEDLPVNERLLTVKEKIKGRETTIILTNSDQINLYRNLYNKNSVSNGEYYETLTENDGYKQVENIKEPLKPLQDDIISEKLFERILTVKNDDNARYEQKINELIAVNKELAEVKGRQLLLEDKAGREGLYLNEINELKTSNKQVQKVNEKLKYVIMTLLMVIIGLIMYLAMVNNVSQPVNNVQEITTQQNETQALKPVPQKSVKK